MNTTQKANKRFEKKRRKYCKNGELNSKQTEYRKWNLKKKKKKTGIVRKGNERGNWAS